MPPNSSINVPKNGVIKRNINDNTIVDDNDDPKQIVSRDYLRVRSEKDDWNCFEHIIWMNVFWFTLLHSLSIYGAYLLFVDAKFYTILFALFTYNVSLFGITAGVHRLWSHRAYKARFPLRLLLAFCNSMAYQNSIFEWARDHRVHHKYSETNADPVNIERGFFFAHIGWLLCRKHPDVKKFGLRLDLSDLKSDPVVYYQHKYYVPSVILMCFLLPTIIPWYYWGENFWTAFFVCAILRYILALQSTWLVNSAAHMFGNRPYDINIAPAENKAVSFLTLGEGYHNYHHVFPWDYSTSEWGWNINLTTFILDQFSRIGWAYDRRFATKEMIRSRKSRTGNTQHYEAQELGY
ncbi:stearoyl-CoA desaturase 5-like [Dermatophagoides pteronyssinus]|uniref:stearoyl-CoA desaturase 5-like n=1 Tax=Dermatophagoides pteronyssinus TaxID=6956 RepID=UPI003F665E30